jgi:hypothetical protein
MAMMLLAGRISQIAARPGVRAKAAARIWPSP